MTSVVVRDDPGQDGGGRALVVFEGVTTVPANARLQIEPSDEASNYRGPRSLSATARATDEGLELAIEVDDALIEHLPAYTAVVLSVPGANLSGEALWPPLTPPSAIARGRSVPEVDRRVVANPVPRPPTPEPSGPTIRRVPAPVVEPSVAADVPTPVLDPPRPETVEKSFHADATSVGQAPSETIKPLPPKPEDHLDRHIPIIEPRRPQPVRDGPSRRIYALVAVVAFVAGALASAGLVALKPDWFMAPVTITVMRRASQFKMPSPYEILMALPPRSPGGQRTTPSSVSELTQRGVEAWKRGDHADAKFWFSWAVRTQLEDKASRTASALANFANVIADGPPDAARFDAARLLWEMAAVAHDCDAMRNIAESFALEKVNEQDQETIEQWKGRAAACQD